MPNNKKPSSLLGRYQRLIKISRDLASMLDLDILLMEITKAAADLADAEEASILLYDPVKEELFFQTATNIDAILEVEVVVPLHNSIAGWIALNREPVIIDNPQEDERHFSLVDKYTNITSRSILGVPLVTKDKIIGVLEAINKKEGNFTTEDQEVLMALGSQAAVAIENSRLFHQSDLIGEFVHEIRTPLSSLSAATHLLQHPRASQEQKDKMFEILNIEIERLAEMSTSFLDLSRLESGRSQFKIEQFDIKELLNECYNLIAKDAQDNQLDIYLEVRDDFPLIRGDRDKIKQAVLNLLINAIKYNKKGGQITLHGTILVEEQELLIAVNDTGLGIEEKYHSLVFEKFYRIPEYSEKASGSGLGLAVVKQIIAGHGGRIIVNSEVGKGTTFTIYLPLL